MPDRIRLRRIDASNIGAHFHLNSDDECYFLFEYTSGQTYSFSQTNNLISNLKKKPSQRARPGYQYKGQAIRECVGYLAGAINPEWLNVATLVPVPPSKAVGHEDYDDRMTQVCCAIRPHPALDVRQLVTQTCSLLAAHEAGEARPSVEDLLQVYSIDEALTDPVPTEIGIFDDVLTAGAHYRAMCTKLHERFPDAAIVGIFIARRVFSPDDLPDVFL